MRGTSERQATVSPLPAPGLRLGRILVPVANPATARGLIQMASSLSGGNPTAEIVALKIVTAPRGMSLDEARRYILPMREQYEGALADAAAYASDAGLPLATELEVAREAAAGILDFAGGLADLGLILLGWRGEVSRRRMRRSINQVIVSQALTNVAVLRLHGPQLGPLRRLLLPVGWGPHARLGLRLAELLAYNTGAAVTVLRVLPMAGEVDWEGERAALVKLIAEEAPRLRYGTQLRLTREPAAMPAILSEARREPYDLIIIGASDEWWVRAWLFGAIPDQVAERAPCPVLLVRRTRVGGDNGYHQDATHDSRLCSP